MQNYTSEGTEEIEPSPPWKIKIVMSCLRIILRDGVESFGNSPQHSSSPKLNPTNQPMINKKQILPRYTIIDQWGQMIGQMIKVNNELDDTIDCNLNITEPVGRTSFWYKLLHFLQMKPMRRQNAFRVRYTFRSAVFMIRGGGGVGLSPIVRFWGAWDYRWSALRGDLSKGS